MHLGFRTAPTDTASFTTKTMSATRPYVISDEDDELVGDSNSELELIDYGTSSSSGTLQDELTLI